jgi:hypothetical protein
MKKANAYIAKNLLTSERYLPRLIKKRLIRVLGFPTRHPYTSKFDTNGIRYVNPDTDLFSAGLATPKFLEKNYPARLYNLVHIHFSFD